MLNFGTPSNYPSRVKKVPWSAMRYRLHFNTTEYVRLQLNMNLEKYLTKKKNGKHFLDTTLMGKLLSIQTYDGFNFPRNKAICSLVRNGSETLIVCLWLHENRRAWLVLFSNKIDQYFLSRNFTRQNISIRTTETTGSYCAPWQSAKKNSIIFSIYVLCP